MFWPVPIRGIMYSSYTTVICETSSHLRYSSNKQSVLYKPLFFSLHVNETNKQTKKTLQLVMLARNRKENVNSSGLKVLENLKLQLYL